MKKKEYLKNINGFEIAIIGMAGKFPGAKNVYTLWKNLCNGQESISFFTKEEMISNGVSELLLSDQNYVNAGGVLDDYDKFDADFFKYSPKEAELLNPQDRLFLEASWEAFEDAGYNILKYKKPVGVFVGVSANRYCSLYETNTDLINNENYWQAQTLGDSSFLPTRISFHLNLTGPSMLIQTACSSSLVAVHIACQSLLSGECKMALAGGSTVNEFQKTGYFYQKNMILSPDGHCRAFDHKASGTVFGNGLGIVILKRLEDAIKDKDRIDAIIKGSAVNNDGALKTGYTAPSVYGQAEVIIEALKNSNVSAEEISYIEAHGTGTNLGDPIEIEALIKAFRHFTKKKNFCFIGSLKTNIGHLNNAAGIAGLIKTVLCLKHKIIPPILHFEKPNINIDFENSPFLINNKLVKWDNVSLPRKAGVSSLGIGGTNAHVILEEAPKISAQKSKRNIRMICFSAKTESSLNTLLDRYLTFLIDNKETNIDDLAYTLHVGRNHYKYRAIILCSTINELIEILKNRKIGDNFLVNNGFLRQKEIVFMFPGQGTQFINMGAIFYRLFPVYKNVVDKCSSILLPLMGLDIRNILYPKSDVTSRDDSLLSNTQFTQILLFIVEYALTQLFISLNICPNYMIGHSIGEYVAACISGVFSLKDALYIVYLRGKLMQSQPKGSMLAIPASYSIVQTFIDDMVSLAAINTKNSCVVSGPTQEITLLKTLLSKKGINTLLLRTSHAFHSKMMFPVLEKFTKELMNIKLNIPQIPFISNISGDWISYNEVIKPEYWGKHIYQPVLFEKGLSTILQEKIELMFLEIGPGHTLSSFVLNHGRFNSDNLVIHTLLNAEDNILVEKHFNLALSKIWLTGNNIDFTNYYQKENRIRLSLPTYFFEHRRYWLPTTPQNYTKDSNIDSLGSSEIDKHTTQDDKSTNICNIYTRDYNDTKEHMPISTDNLECKIVEIWESVFGITKINVSNDFFDLGGNSLIAVQIVAKIKKILNIDLPVTIIFEKHSVCELARFIRNII